MPKKVLPLSKMAIPMSLLFRLVSKVLAIPSPILKSIFDKLYRQYSILRYEQLTGLLINNTSMSYIAYCYFKILYMLILNRPSSNTLFNVYYYTVYTYSSLSNVLRSTAVNAHQEGNKLLSADIYVIVCSDEPLELV